MGHFSVTILTSTGSVLSDIQQLRLKERAEGILQYCRLPYNRHHRDEFRETYFNLLNVFITYVSQVPDFADKDLSEPSQAPFWNVGRLVAYAEFLGVESPEAFKDLVRNNDNGAPLDFLLDTEVLHSKYPNLEIGFTAWAIDSKLPF